MPTFTDHLNACREAAGSEADALQLAETTWDTLPVRLAAERGHTVVQDGVTHLRWTCTTCQRAVLRVDANVYGSAIEEDCARRRPAVPETVAVSAHLLPGRTAPQLLNLARRGLAEAAQTGPAGLRYAAAHLAALRAGAAILAVRARPVRKRRAAVTGVWTLLAQVAPEFDQWATFFTNTTIKRAAAEAGIPRVVTAREADDLLRAVEQFVSLVEDSIGVTSRG